MLTFVKDFLSKHRLKIGAVVGLATVAGIGIVVGDVTLAQVWGCVSSFDLSSVSCAALNGPHP